MRHRDVNAMTETEKAPSLLAFWQPRYWPIWAGLGLLRLLVLLPYPVMMATGRTLGRLAGLTLPGRRAVAAANLRLCFPEIGAEGQRALLSRYFASLGQQALELGMAWWSSDARIERLMRIEGLEHLERATAGGRGAILLSGHFATVELAGRIMRLRGWECAGLYRPNRNRLVDEILRRGRLRALAAMIPKDSMRQMVRRLSQGVPVWYAPDQSYRRRYSVLVPFFGEPAMTNAALTHIARIGHAPVVPFYSRRLEDGSGYLVSVEPEMQGFPTGDMEADARRVNAWLEEHIRRAPEQYYWIHRRFKGRPLPYPDPYAR
jgi:KDO2-lipid IV(A) lauroyltransferase